MTSLDDITAELKNILKELKSIKHQNSIKFTKTFKKVLEMLQL